MSDSLPQHGLGPARLLVHGIRQARIWGWAAVLFSRGLPNPGTELRSSALQADSSLSESPGKPYFLRGIFQCFSFWFAEPQVGLVVKNSPASGRDIRDVGLISGL